MKFVRSYEWLAIAYLIAVALPASAQVTRTGDPCAGVSAESALATANHVRLEHDAAIVIVKHMQRACKRIDTWIHGGLPTMNEARAKTLRELVDRIQREVLTPIYGEYPEMRGQDLTEAAVKLPERGRSENGSVSPEQPKRIGLATALHLRWALEEMEWALVNAPDDSPLHCKMDAAAKCGLTNLDIAEEFGFAAHPIYAVYPDLWRLAMEHSARTFPAPARTAKSDAEFRKAKAAAGPLQLSSAALSYLQEFDNESRKYDTGCQIIAISWTNEQKIKGPDDTDSKPLPPGVTVGGYWCQFIPPDVVQTIGRLRIVVTEPEAERFAGKTIARENGKLVLEDAH
jgi:hypothetical protein